MTVVELPSQRLAGLGIDLPEPRKPVGNFRPYVWEGNLLFLSGQGPVLPSGEKKTGVVGLDVGVSDAYEHARLTTINLLSIVNDAIGSIDNVDRIVKILGFVNASPSFSEHPAVLNGCSDLLLSVFGPDRGSHARSAIGAGSLPGNITVEIEMILSVSAENI